MRLNKFNNTSLTPLALKTNPTAMKAKSYRSDELVYGEEKRDIGSLKRDVYLCIYEKDYVQFIEYSTSIEDTDVKNRFEIRLKNDRA